MRCVKKKTNRKQCRARALSGSKFCALHADPGKAAELGSRGGRRRATKGAPPAETAPVEPPKTAEELRDVLAEAVAQVKTGQLDTKTANALAYTGTALLRAIEVSSYESRLAVFESRLLRRGN